MSAGLDSLRRVLDSLGERTPARLTRWAAQIEAAPEARQPGLLAALAVLEPALEYLGGAGVGGGIYPAAPIELRARLALGERPVDLAPGLSRAEAHAWLLAGAPPVVRWLLAREGTSVAVEPHSLAVAQWLIAALRDPPRAEALRRPRREILAGRAIEGAYLDRVDELRDRDLRASIEVTYQRAARRLMASLERALRSRGEPICAVPRWWVPVRCARLLRSGQDLVAEGRALGHCVATYADAVRSGDSVIVGLAVCGHRSTVEIAPREMRVRQHRGPRNQDPHPLCVRALAVCARRWGVTP